MEQSAKQQLIARLDECLMEHFEALKGQDGGAGIKDLYELQDLAAVHYYLKVEHEFTPAEVEALLQFEDPLDVARWCREDNTHKHSFPICELLHEINAYQRFPQVSEIEPPLAVRFAELKEALDKNLADYKAHLLDCDKQALIDKAVEIAAAVNAHDYMTNHYQPKAREVDFLLRFEDPLQVVQAFWPERPHELLPLDFVMESLMDDMYCPLEEQPQATGTYRPKEKPSGQEKPQDMVGEAASAPRRSPSPAWEKRVSAGTDPCILKRSERFCHCPPSAPPPGHGA